MDPATIQGVVRRLIARGLMRRGRDPMDRRTAVLEPTEAGVALIASVVASARRSTRRRCRRCRRRSSGNPCPVAQDGLRPWTDAGAADAGLGFGLSSPTWRLARGWCGWTSVFLERLAAEDAALHARLLAARAAPDARRRRTKANWWWRSGRISMRFVAALFGIEAETLALARETHALDPIHACKRLFVQRQAVKKYPDPSGFDGAALRAALEALIGEPLTERAFAEHVAAWENGRRRRGARSWRCATPPGRR